MATKQLNVRLPEISHKQLQELRQRYGLTQVQVLVLALDRFYREDDTGEDLKGRAEQLSEAEVERYQRERRPRGRPRKGQGDGH